MTPLTPWVADPHDIAHAAARPDASSWLLEDGSLTERLRQRWPALRVDVLAEGVLAPQADECEALALSSTADCWVRAVRLVAGDKRLIHARTVIPAWGDGNPWQMIATLGRRPLGELLFSLPGVQRSPLAFALIAPDPSGGDPAVRSMPARRRLFRYQGAPLLLTEAFDLLTARDAF